MPVYEYECEHCACRFELRRGFAEGGAATCPECQGGAHLVFSPVPIIFKGSGFYTTDHMVGRRDEGEDKSKEEGSSASEG